MSPLKIASFAIFFQLVWSLVPSASQVILSHISVELYTAFRWTLSGLTFLFLVCGRREWQSLERTEWIKLFFLGAWGYGVSSFGTLYGQKIGGVVHYAFLTAVSPVISSLTAIVVLRERPAKSFIYAALLCVVGSAVLVVGKYEISSVYAAVASTLLVFLSCVADAFPFSYSKKYATKIPLFQYLAVLQLSVAAIMWILEFSIFHHATQLRILPAIGWASLVFVSIGSCVMAYAGWYALLRHVQGHQLAMFQGLHPVFAAFFGCLFFDERLHPMMFVGAVILLCGLYVSLRVRNETEQEAV